MVKRVGVWMAVLVGISLIVAACGGGQATQTPAPAATTQVLPTATLAALRPTATLAPSPTATQQIGIRPTPVSTATQAPAAGPQPKYGGTLNVRYFQDYRRWDTWRVDSAFSYPFDKALMSNIVQYRQGTFDFVGELAESWEVGGDGKTYTFHLRKGAQWHDGTPFTSRDIVYNFQRGADPQYVYNKSRVDPVQSMETPDDATFRTTLKDRSNSWLPQVATPFMLMYPAHIPDMTQWQKSPIGTGPFKFAADKPSSSYEFVRNPAYILKDAQGRSLPYLDGITFFVIPDQGLSLSAMLTGKVHCGCTVAEFWVIRNEARLRSDIAGVKLLRHLGAKLQLYFNVKRPPLDNLAFRQAVAIGMDKAKMAETFAFGQNYQPAPALVPPEFGGQWGLPKDELQKLPGYNPDHSADLKIMKQKIDQSGIDPKKVRLPFLTTPSFADLADLLASYFKSDLGIDASVQAVATTVEQEKALTAGEFTVWVNSEGGIIDDPLDWYKDWIITGGSRNAGGYSNPRVDEILRTQEREPDPSKRKQIITELQRIELTEFPEVPILWQYGMKGTWPEVMDFKVGPINLQNYEWASIWLDKK